MICQCFIGLLSFFIVMNKGKYVIIESQLFSHFKTHFVIYEQMFFFSALQYQKFYQIVSCIYLGLLYNDMWFSIVSTELTRVIWKNTGMYTKESLQKNFKYEKKQLRQNIWQDEISLCCLIFSVYLYVFMHYHNMTNFK